MPFRLHARKASVGGRARERNGFCRFWRRITGSERRKGASRGDESPVADGAAPKTPGTTPNKPEQTDPTSSPRISPPAADIGAGESSVPDSKARLSTPYHGLSDAQSDPLATRLDSKASGSRPELEAALSAAERSLLGSDCAPPTTYISNRDENRTGDGARSSRQTISDMAAASSERGRAGTAGSASTSISAAEWVWNAAYEELRQHSETAELVEDHEKIMSMQLQQMQNRGASSQAGREPVTPPRKLHDIDNIFSQLSASGRQKLMHKLALEGLEHAENRSAVRENVLAGVQFAQSCRDAIGAALEANPYASFAWTGVCAILPLIENATNQPLEHTILLRYVLDQARWYSGLTTALSAHGPSTESISDIRREIMRRITEIYKLLIKTIMLSIRRYYYKNKLVIFAADAVKWYDWKQVYNEIKQAEEDYRQCSSQYYQESALSAIRSLDVHLQQQERQDRYNDTINQWSNYRTHRNRTDPPELLAGTGGWFFKHPAFTAWSGWTPPSRLLLLKANPGCGKSVLASEVVKRLEEEGRLTVCHFFFKEGSGDSGAETALCAILHQLLSRHGELLDRPMKGGLSIVNYAQQNKNAPPERKVEVLWDILEAATHDYESQNVGVVCVLDALNECESQVEILNLFEQRLRQCSNKDLSGIRFLITSRFTFSETAGPSSRFALIDVERIETDAQASRTGRERERDFERVIQYRVESITTSSSEQAELKRLLGLSPGQPQRSLLWVDLVFKFLAQKKKKANFFSNWLSNVELLPQTVDDAYGRLLEQSEQHWSQKDDLITIFQIVIAARRVLRLRELCEACAIHGGDGAMVKQARAGSLPIDEFKETIQQKCGFFLVLDEEENVAFFHQTAQDFLRAALSPRAAGKTAEHSSWKGSVDVTSAHTLVAQICAQSICLSLVDEDAEDGASLDVENPSMDFKTWAMRKPFFPYAARMLDYHLENSSIGTEAKYRYRFADTARRQSRLLGRPNHLSDKLQMLSNKLLALEGDSTMPPSKLMSINPAATDDFPHLMAVGPAELSVSIGVKNGPQYSNLLGTLSDSYFSRFELLGSLRDLEQAIDLYLGAETRGLSYGGASKASQRLESFVKLLLEPGPVDMNVKEIGQKFLQRAAASGKVPIVKLLLSTGKIDVGGRDEDGKTALWWAVRNCHHAIVWLLFETGKADIEPDQKELLFRWAASRGDEEFVRRLVNTDNFDLNARDSDGTTAVWQAAKYGSNGIIDLLVRTGRVEIDARDSNGQTPLGRAAQNGLTTTADLLLSTGKADPDARDKDGRTPLWHAASYGYVDVVKRLILSGETVDLDAKDTEGQSPLWIAAVKGHNETVRVLLSTGNVDPDTTDSTGRRLQSVAAENGLDAMVEMLAGHTKPPT